MTVADTLVLAYGLHPAEMTQIPEGTSTDNYAIVDQTGRRHFAKVYRTREHLGLERASVELPEYAADGGVATAAGNAHARARTYWDPRPPADLPVVVCAARREC